MTREEKLITMRMQDLEMVAAKLGIKINKKGSKQKAIEKILEAENANWEKESNEMKEAQEKKQQESDKAAEDAVNKKKKEPVSVIKPDDLVENPGDDGKHYITAPKRGQLIEYNGKSQNICAWAKELGKSANTLYGRIYKMGWSIEDAFEK